MQLGFILVLIVSIFIAIFAIQNGNPVPLDLFLARYEVPLAVVMMVCLVLGASIALFLGTFRQLKKHSMAKDLKNKVKTYETEKADFDKNMETVTAQRDELQKAIETMKTQMDALTESNEELKSKANEIKTVSMNDLKVGEDASSDEYDEGNKALN